MEIWDYDTAMCAPRAMPGMPMTMLMVHANSFLTQDIEEGPRGTNALTLPNMFMADIGKSFGDRNYINLQYMGTLERWTFPNGGNPELLQIGEENGDHQPYVDAQHPHSSPVMGLTLSDTYSLGEGKDFVKIWFAPRGQSIDGPIAFMHRATGMVNPDAPLGHHVGQDAGHISSTVFGASIHLTDTTFEATTYYGQEPEPSKVDLPINTPNSYSARFIQAFGATTYAMISAAFVKNPEVHDTDLDHIWRYSASVYSKFKLGGDWDVDHTFIYGLINGYDNTSALTSFSEEFALNEKTHSIWGRIEVLERTAEELLINPGIDINKPRFVTAITLGTTEYVQKLGDFRLSLGASLTKDILPMAFHNAYGGDPLTAKVFLNLGGMKMWEI